MTDAPTLPDPAASSARAWLRPLLLVVLLGGSLTPAVTSVHDAFELPKTALLIAALLALGIGARLTLVTTVRPPSWVIAAPAVLLLHLLLVTDGESLLAAGHWIVLILAADASWRIFGPRVDAGEPASAAQAPLPSRTIAATDHDLWWAPPIAAIAISVIAITQFAGSVWPAWPEATNSTPAAFFGNRNIAAMVLVALVPFLAMGFARRTIRESRGLAVVALLLTCIALLLIRSRASMAAGAVGLIATGLVSAIAWRREALARAAADGDQPSRSQPPPHAGPLKLPVLSVSAGILAVAMLLHPMVPMAPTTERGFKGEKQTAADTLKSALSGQSEGFAIRKVLAAKTIGMSADGAGAAFLGHGLGRWAIAYPAYNGTGPDWWFSEKVQPEHAHNDILQLIAEVGWPAGLALVALAGWCAIVLLRPSRNDPLAFAAGGSLVAMLAFAAGDAPVQYAVPAGWIGFLVGLALVRLPGARSSPRIAAVTAWLIPLGAALWLTIGLPSAWQSSHARRQLGNDLIDWSKEGLPAGTTVASLLDHYGYASSDEVTGAVALQLGLFEAGRGRAARVRAQQAAARGQAVEAAELRTAADAAFVASIAHATRSLEKRPNQINALVNRARAKLYLRVPDVEGARADIEAALAIAPGVWTLWRDRLSLASDHGDIAESAALTTRIRKLSDGGWFSPYARGPVKSDREVAAEWLAGRP
jgi:O-antigen ligase